MAQNRPTVSVIVPMYQVEAYLPGCIDSILGGTYADWELILVDDGSPDRCGELAEEYAAKDRRIRVIRQANGGLSAARNAGIQAATGEWLFFVDSDDYLAPDALAIMLDTAEQTGADLCICNINYVDDRGNEIEQMNALSPLQNEVLTAKEALAKLALPTYWFYVPAWNKMCRRALFEGLSFPPGKLHEDEFVVHHLIGRAQKIAVTDRRLYCYVQREGSIMKSAYSIKRLDSAEAMLDRVDYLLAHDDPATAFATLDKLAVLLDLGRKQLRDEGGKARLKDLHSAAKVRYIRLKASYTPGRKPGLKLFAFFRCPLLYRGYVWLCSVKS